MSIATTELAPQPTYSPGNAVASVTQTYGSPRQGPNFGGVGSKAAAVTAMFLLATPTTVAVVPNSFTTISEPTSEKIPLPRTVQHTQAGVAEVKAQLVKQVRDLGSLQVGWHNPDSSPATQRAVDDAERFIRRNDWNMLATPIISLTDDGEINLVWSDDNRHLDIGFFGDGTYAYYGKGRDGASYMEDGAAVSKTLPSPVIALIAAAAA